MPLPIQNLPKGLVGYLGLNTGGAGPPVLADQIGGVLDVAEFYNLYQRERSLVTGVAAGGGAAGSFAFTAQTVPQNEAWLIYMHVINVNIVIGLTWQGCTAVQMQAGAGNQSFATGKNEQNATSAIASFLMLRSERPFIAPPNAILGGVTCSVSGAGAATANSVLDFVRFRL